MPEVTLVSAPSPHAAAKDSVTGQEFVVGVPVQVDEECLSRLRSLEPFHYYFEVSETAPTPTAPVVDQPPAEQAVTTSAPEAPAQ